MSQESESRDLQPTRDYINVHLNSFHRDELLLEEAGLRNPGLAKLVDQIDGIIYDGGTDTAVNIQTLLRAATRHDLSAPYAWRANRLAQDLTYAQWLEEGVNHLNQQADLLFQLLKDKQVPYQQRRNARAHLEDLLTRAIYFAPHLITGINVIFTEEIMDRARKTQGNLWVEEDRITALGYLIHYFEQEYPQPLDSLDLPLPYSDHSDDLDLGYRGTMYGRQFVEDSLWFDIGVSRGKSLHNELGLNLKFATTSHGQTQDFRLAEVSSLSFSTAPTYTPIVDSRQVYRRGGDCLFDRGWPLSHYLHFIDFRKDHHGQKVRVMVAQNPLSIKPELVERSFMLVETPALSSKKRFTLLEYEYPAHAVWESERMTEPARDLFGQQVPVVVRQWRNPTDGPVVEYKGNEIIRRLMTTATLDPNSWA